MNLNNLKHKFSTFSRNLDKDNGNINNIVEKLDREIDKDLVILKEKINEYVSIQEEIYPLSLKLNGVKKDCFDLANKFLEKNSSYEDKSKLGKLETYLNSGMDSLTLLNIMGVKDGIPEVNNLLRKIIKGNSIDKEIYSRDSKIFDYVSSKENNERIMHSYSNIIKDIDSIEFNSDSVDMSHLGCLIDPKLHDLLENSFKYKQTGKPGKTDSNSFYVVVFNTLKSKENDKVRYDLIYNYTQYNKIFLMLFYVYISIQQSSMIIHNNLNIGSSYFFCMDSKLKKHISIDSDWLKDLISKEFDFNDKRRNSKPFNLIDLCKLCVKGTLIEAEISTLQENILILLGRDSSNFLNNLINISGYVNNNALVEYEKMFKGNMYRIFNPMSRFIYIVSDLKSFTNGIQKINCFNALKSVNSGSQQFRGSTSHLNNILSRLDKDFRDSMYKHNLNFLGNNALKKSKFSFNNVHINLGNSRWYSTTGIVRFYSNIHSSNNNVYSETGSIINNNHINEENRICTSSKKNFNIYGNGILFKTNHFKHISSKDPSLFLYSNLIDIMVNNPINENSQRLIEKFLIDQFEKLVDEVSNNSKDMVSALGVDINLFNGKFKEYCMDKKGEIKSYIKNLRDKLNDDRILDKDVNEIKTKIDIYNFYFKLIMNEVNNSEIQSCLFYSLFKVVSFNGMIQTDDIKSNIRPDGISVLNISLYIGKYLTNKYYKKIYEKYLNTISISNVNIEGSNQENISLREFKISYLKKDNKNSIINEDEFFLHVGSKLLEILLVSDMLSIKVLTLKENKTQSVLVCNKEIDSLLERKNPVSILPQFLPMIVKPKPYSTSNSLGGFLLNGEHYESHLFTDKLAYAIPSEIEENSCLLSAINNLMNTPFKVNKVLLNYLLENNHIHNLLIDPDYKHPLGEKQKRTKYEEKEFQSFLSKRMLEQNILIIADIYSNVHEFYFPIKLDHRGRLYPSGSYFHYQSNELAKALILFSRPDSVKRTDIDAMDYLKAYGASCYGKGLNKKSYSKRVKWVEQNWTEIIDYENSKLVKNADDKFLFLSFCIEMKRFDDFLNNENANEFKTYLPIQLDGTCNGFQHLALLSNETDLFAPLNLTESNKNADPNDLYSHILDNLNVYIEDKRQKIKDKNDEIYKSYTRLINLGLSRKEIKHSIMNKPYNAKDRTLAQYVKDSLKLHNREYITIMDKKGETKNIVIGLYKVEGSNTNNCVNYRDIELLIECINNIIYVKYRNILLLTNYFKDMARILNKLNLPIMWRLPNGLKVSQKYMSKRSIKIEPFTFIDNSITLTITDKIKIDKNKQISALMPNIVHSLDAAALILLYNSFFNSIDKNDNVNFYSVHDCYGVTAKYVDSLINHLRTVYISIYSNKGYIEKFDEDILISITQLYGERNCTFSRYDRVLHVKGETDIKLPKISDFLQKNNKDLVYNRLSKSIYFIN